MLKEKEDELAKLVGEVIANDGRAEQIKDQTEKLRISCMSLNVSSAIMLTHPAASKS
jgi:hypothetical protein